jgi:hypothetical protein
MGSTFLDEHNDTASALRHWRIATVLRHTFGTSNGPIPKRPVMQPRAAFRYATEFKTMDDLNNVALDLDAMRIQSLLICERVLGPHHKDALFRLMYRGAAYADALRYQRCIELWQRALEIRVEKDTVIFFCVKKLHVLVEITCTSSVSFPHILCKGRNNDEN